MLWYEEDKECKYNLKYIIMELSSNNFVVDDQKSLLTACILEYFISNKSKEKCLESKN